MKKVLLTLIAVLFVLSPAYSQQDAIKGNIIEKDLLKRVITVDLGTKDGIKVGSAFVLHDKDDRELACILVAEVTVDTFISDLIPMKSFEGIDVGYHVEELGSGCRIEGAEMSYIPEGYFGMGDSKRDNEMPMQGIFLEAYYIDKYEVTNEQYKIFLGDRKRAAPSSDAEEARHYNWVDGDYMNGKDTHPVVLVSADDAKEYCEYVGKKLPTEAEWEKAARGTGNRIWPWGNVWDKNKLNSKENGMGVTAIIGSFPDDLSPYDVLDMGGNVSEWTSSTYRAYNNNYKVDEDYDKGSLVIRGGSFKTGKVDSRTPARKYAAPKTKFISVGFRCVKEIN